MSTSMWNLLDMESLSHDFLKSTFPLNLRRCVPLENLYSKNGVVQTNGEFSRS